MGETDIEMTKDVMIQIKGKQSYPEGEKLETVTEVAAEYYFRNGSHYVMYEEAEEGFKQGNKCMLKVHECYVELTKKGLVRSYMVFEEGKLHMTEYHTPFGMVLLGVRTKSVEIVEREETLTIHTEYALESNEELIADCKIQITIQERKDN